MMEEIEFKAIDKYFPKGDKRRGEVLVINAEAFLLGKEESKKEILEKIEKCEIKTFNHLEGISFPSDLISKKELKKEISNE